MSESMETVLSVVTPFGIYAKGARITDPVMVATILNSYLSAYVIAVAGLTNASPAALPTSPISVAGSSDPSSVEVTSTTTAAQAALADVSALQSTVAELSAALDTLAAREAALENVVAGESTTIGTLTAQVADLIARENGTTATGGTTTGAAPGTTSNFDGNFSRDFK